MAKGNTKLGRAAQGDEIKGEFKNEYSIKAENSNFGNLVMGSNPAITIYNSYTYLYIDERKESSSVESSGSESSKKSKRSKKRKKNKKRKVESDGYRCQTRVKAVEGNSYAQKTAIKEKVQATMTMYDVYEQVHCSGTSSVKEYKYANVAVPEQKQTEVSQRQISECLRQVTMEETARNSVLILKERSTTVSHNSINIESNAISDEDNKFPCEDTGKKRIKVIAPIQIAVQQIICYAWCIAIGCYFDLPPWLLPYVCYLVFVIINILACLSCMKFKYQTYDPPELAMLVEHLNEHHRLELLARIQLDFFIKDREALPKLLALFLCVSLSFLSSQIFGCKTCSWWQTIVLFIASTYPYLAFEGNRLLPKVLMEHCQVFKDLDAKKSYQGKTLRKMLVTDISYSREDNE